MYTFALIVVLIAICSAQKNYNPLPPEVAFISGGKFTGSLRTPVGSLLTKGSIDYLAAAKPGDTEYEKREVVLEFGLETTKTWEVETTHQIDTWEISDLFPDNCLHQTFDEESGMYPECNAWTRNAFGAYVQNCTIYWGPADLADLSIAVVLSSNNQLVTYNDQIVLIGQFVESESVTMTEQGSTPPTPSDFIRPSVCNSQVTKQ